MSLAKLAAKGLVWSSLESFALSGLSLICLVVFAHYLSPEDLGVAAIALAIVQVVGLPVELLFHDALIQRKDLEPSHTNSAFTVSVAMGVVFCAGCWLSADLVEHAMNTPRLGSVLKWMSLSLIGSGFGSALIAMQRRRMEFRSLALRSLVGRASSAVIAIALVFLGVGVWTLVVQQVLLVCLGTFTLWILSKERPRFQFALGPTRELVSYGWLSMTRSLLSLVVPRMFMVMVGGYLGTTTVGLLSLAFRGLDMLRDLSAIALYQVAMPLFARLQDSREALYTAFDRALQLTSLVAFPAFVGLAVCAPEVLTIAFGAKWIDATPYFALIALLNVPFFLRLYSSAVLNAIGKPGAPVIEAIAQIVFLLAGMLTIGRNSSDHAMTVWATRLLISVPIDMWMLRRMSGLGYEMQLRGAVLPAAASTAMGGILLVLKPVLFAGQPPFVRIWPIALLGVAIYLGVIMLVGRRQFRQVISYVGQTLQTRG